MPRLVLCALLLALLAGHASADAPASPDSGSAALPPPALPGFFWSGTALACGASPSDCTANAYYSWGHSASGNGLPCASGEKYLCASAPRSDWHAAVVGTAPFCDASCSDCPQGYSCWTWTNSGISSVDGGGRTCLFGVKYICIKPKVE